VWDLKEQTWQKVQWISLILFIIATFLFVIFISRYEISTAQHVWCHVITTLNNPPAPKGAPATNPSRAYDQELANEFKQLKEQLGC
jgi:hypothetical protein